MLKLSETKREHVGRSGVNVCQISELKLTSLVKDVGVQCSKIVYNKRIVLSLHFKAQPRLTMQTTLTQAGKKIFILTQFKKW